MANKAALSPEERAVVRARVEKLVAEVGSQTAVAQRIGCTQQVVSKALKGDAGFSFVRKLASALGMTFETLMQSQDEAITVPAPIDELRALPDLAALNKAALVDRLTTLARRQLRAVLGRSPLALQGSVELADAALELVQRLNREPHTEDVPPARVSAYGKARR